MAAQDIARGIKEWQETLAKLEAKLIETPGDQRLINQIASIRDGIEADKQRLIDAALEEVDTEVTQIKRIKANLREQVAAEAAYRDAVAEMRADGEPLPDGYA